MVAAGGKPYVSSSFNTDFTYALKLGTGLASWYCSLLNVVTVPLEVTGKMVQNAGRRAHSVWII